MKAEFAEVEGKLKFECVVLREAIAVPKFSRTLRPLYGWRRFSLFLSLPLSQYESAIL